MTTTSSTTTTTATFSTTPSTTNTTTTMHREPFHHHNHFYHSFCSHKKIENNLLNKCSKMVNDDHRWHDLCQNHHFLLRFDAKKLVGQWNEGAWLNWYAPPGRFFRHFIVFLGDISWYLGPEDLSILFLQSRTYVGLFLPPFYSWYKNPHAVNSIWYTSETVLLEKWEITKGTFYKRRS